MRRALLAVLCLPYLVSGVAKAVGFDGAIEEFRGLPLPAPALLVVATILVQLCGSALVITGRMAWAGALALAAFTIVASLIAHAFWNFTGQDHARQLNTFLEHVALAGAFCLVAWDDRHRAHAAS